MSLLDNSIPEEVPPKPLVGLCSFLIAVALVGANVALYLLSRSLEAHSRQSFPDGRPWLWPEEATGFFVFVWLLTLFVGIFAVFRMRKTPFRFPPFAISILALAALLANGFCLIMEAFDF